MAVIRILKFLSLVFISTPFIKKLSVQNQAFRKTIQLLSLSQHFLYLLPSILYSAPHSFNNFSASYHFTQLQSHFLICHYSMYFTTCNTMYHINSAQLSLSRKGVRYSAICHFPGPQFFLFKSQLCHLSKRPFNLPGTYLYLGGRNSSFQHNRYMKFRKKCDYFKTHLIYRYR